MLLSLCRLLSALRSVVHLFKLHLPTEVLLGTRQLLPPMISPSHLPCLRFCERLTCLWLRFLVDQGLTGFRRMPDPCQTQDKEPLFVALIPKQMP